MPSTNDTVLPIAVLTRVPTPGRVKTRLESVVSPEDAARLQEAFLKDVLAASALVPGAKVELHVAGDLAHPAIAALRETYPCYAQVEGDLGARITAAADRLVAEYGRAIVLGSDAPTLPASYLEAAGAALVDSDAVIGPTADGGFCILGVRRALGESLLGVRWSSSHACADASDRLEARCMRVSLLAPWYDVDTPRELSLLRAHLETAPLAAPYTARVLRQVTFKEFA